jgi:hypothetical protein
MDKPPFFRRARHSGNRWSHDDSSPSAEEGPNRWLGAMNNLQHAYEVRPRKDHRGVDLISDARFYSRSHATVIRVYGEAGHVIETHEHAGEFKEW